MKVLLGDLGSLQQGTNPIIHPINTTKSLPSALVLQMATLAPVRVGAAKRTDRLSTTHSATSRFMAAPGVFRFVAAV